MYSKAITQQHRSAVIFCIDCSTSMQELVEFNDVWMSKAEVVAMITNIMIDELYTRSSRHNRIRNYYDIAVIGYRGDSVENLLDGEHIELTPITALEKLSPKTRDYCFKQKLHDGTSIYANFVINEWITAKAEGRTPMYEALIEAHRLVDEWCAIHSHRDSFPPMIFHITDGYANDGTPNDLISIAQDIKNTGTTDGNTLLINVHIGSGEDYCERSLLFPYQLDMHNSSSRMHTLYMMSSVAPESIEHQLPPIEEPEVESSRRLVAYNISPCELFNIVNIGSESLKE